MNCTPKVDNKSTEEVQFFMTKFSMEEKRKAVERVNEARRSVREVSYWSINSCYWKETYYGSNPLPWNLG